MSQPTILIASPIQNRQAYLPYYLSNLLNLNYPKENVSFYFIINNSQDNSEQILKDFKSNHRHKYNNITIDYYNGNKNAPQDKRDNTIRLKHSYTHLSNLRNMVLKYTYKNNYDYLFSVDSDIIVPSNILTKLLSHNVEIVSSLIWNGFLYRPSEPYKYPNILNQNSDGKYEHISNWYVKNAPILTESKLIEVSATGACILMTNEVCKKTKYSWHSQGEDMSWSEDCRNKGFKLFCDVGCYSHHCMNEQMLDEYIAKLDNKLYVKYTNILL